VVGSQRRCKSAVGNQQWQAREEVESADSGFVEQRRAWVEVAAVTEEHVGGRRWHSMGGRPRQQKEAADSVL
jgi:hypothetical protein